MDQASLESLLKGLAISSIRYFDQVGSTNDIAAAWAEDGAPDLALVVADEQTAGKGRLGRRWVTPARTALAFSLVLHPQPGEVGQLPRFSALGALAVCAAVRHKLSLQPQVKWPNDVLLGLKKVCGVLAEAHWDGSTMASLVLGIGVNVASTSTREEVLPSAGLNYPATSLEAEAGCPVDRWEMLRAVLEELLSWRLRLTTPQFFHTWEDSLAFRGSPVTITGRDPHYRLEGILLGLSPEGGLRLQLLSGEITTVLVGDVRLEAPGLK